MALAQPLEPGILWELAASTGRAEKRQKSPSLVGGGGEAAGSGSGELELWKNSLHKQVFKTIKEEIQWEKNNAGGLSASPSTALTLTPSQLSPGKQH